MAVSAPRQSWNPERYRRNAAFVAELAGGVGDLLAPRAGERILDLGRGLRAVAIRRIQATFVRQSAVIATSAMKITRR